MDPRDLHPRVGVAVLLMKDGKLLLGKRKGSHGAGEYASPGGHLEHLERFSECAEREVREETGLEIGPIRFLRVLNTTQYAPRHYVDIAFAADWVSGEPEVREPEKVERWDWYDLASLPSPLFGTLPTAIEALRTGQPFWDGP
jgi:8-oxo-dGTP diphosphatase